MKALYRYKWIRRTFLVLLLLISCAVVYVAIVNRNSTDMTIRQKLMKAFYPFLMRITGSQGKSAGIAAQVKAPVSFYTLTAVKNDGAVFNFSGTQGKKLLLVNTASDCGYTGQLDELEKLYRQYNKEIIVIGFPSNDFKQQEKGTDAEIAAFCKLNYGVSFPLMKKGSVVKSPVQQEVYQWLTDKKLNGWNDKAPGWNFSKYIIDESGNLTHVFGPAVSLAGSEIKNALKLQN